MILSIMMTYFFGIYLNTFYLFGFIFDFDFLFNKIVGISIGFSLGSLTLIMLWIIIYSYIDISIL